MLIKLLSLVPTTQKLYMYAAIAALVIAAIVYHKATVSALNEALSSSRASVGELTVVVATLTAEKQGLLASIDRQNTAVMVMSQRVTATSHEAELAIAEAATVARNWEARYRGVLNGPRPQGSDCEALESTVGHYLGMRLEEEGTP